MPIVHLTTDLERRIRDEIRRVERERQLLHDPPLQVWERKAGYLAALQWVLVTANLRPEV